MTVPFSACALIEEGDLLEGVTSGATAKVVNDPVILSGVILSNTAVIRVVLENLVGTFQSGEALKVNGTTTDHTVSSALIAAVTEQVCTSETL